MDIRAIHNEADLDWALAEVEPYFKKEPEPGTPDGDRFEILTSLIEAYEDKRWAIPTDIDPIAVIEHAIKDLGRSRKELVAIIGSRGRVSEILGKQRALTIEMIRAISKEWKLPVELLIQPYKLKLKAPKSPAIKQKTKRTGIAKRTRRSRKAA
jgi:HTH-type transcriptional regulator / antitoxin HigA